MHIGHIVFPRQGCRWLARMQVEFPDQKDVALVQSPNIVVLAPNYKHSDMDVVYPKDDSPITWDAEGRFMSQKLSYQEEAYREFQTN